MEFLGLAGLGQAEASSLTWGDVNWTNNRLHVRSHKTNTYFHVPIYEHLRPLLERLSKARRGKRSPASLVFKIKDARRASGFACQRLKSSAFCQRSLRQHLIGRLWKAGVDRKLIALWQGHQDGGQLAKLSGEMAVAPSGSDVDGLTFGAMKGPKKSHALPPAPADSVPPPALAAAVNSYTKGDKVGTKLGGKGDEVQAEVVAVYKDEVQVRTPDGELPWRIRTVEPTGVVQVAPEPAQTELVTRRRCKRMKQKRR